MGAAGRAAADMQTLRLRHRGPRARGPELPAPVQRAGAVRGWTLRRGTLIKSAAWQGQGGVPTPGAEGELRAQTTAA